MKKNIILSMLFCIVSFSGFTQERNNMPEWYYYQKSLEAFRADDFGEALRQLKNLVDNYGESADSLHIRARIYEQEGELDLAERYYLESLSKGSFRIPQDKYLISYRLANIYNQRKNYKKYEDILLNILSGQEMYSHARYARMRDAFISTLLDRGFDSLAVLYRVPLDFSLEAHARLGVWYTRTGRYRAALLHFAFANLMAVSVLSDELKILDPDYTFTSLDDIISKTSSNPKLEDFFKRNDIYRNLYFLASTLYSLGSSRESRRIWEITARYASGEWRNLSRSQLLEPKAEALITY